MKSNSNLYKLYYLTNYISCGGAGQMFKDCFMELIKLNPGTVYVHNLSKFDSFFINKILFENFEVNAKYKGRLILSLNIKYREGKQIYKMIFKDSLLLLAGSLKNLGEKYEVETQKGVFPYTFPNINNLDYVGGKPDYIFYHSNTIPNKENINYIGVKDEYNISIEEYNKIPKTGWNLKDETFKYLLDDLRSLYQILVKFSNIIYNSERLNITKISTVSSLAFKIIKANYLEPDKIYQINGNSHRDIRNAYYGGRVDSFKPYGRKIKCYDVNSLYPFSMLNVLPGGEAIMSNDKYLDNYFGVVYANIETPKDNFGNYLEIKYPPLPFKNKDGRLINPIGR
jgi:DNA polymerase type B, organellar and viral